ncbi:MAG TPA: DNA/RNA non-specific endonuclease [Burkholderiales bacterium]
MPVDSAPKAVNRPAAPQPASAARVVRSPLARGRAREKQATPVAPFQAPYLARFRQVLAKVTSPPAVSQPTKAHKPPAPAGESAVPEAAPEAAGGEALARAPRRPADDPQFQKAKGEIRRESRRQRSHPPASRKRTEATDASAMTEGEQIEQSAKEKSTREMEKVGSAQQGQAKRFSAEAFKKDLMERVNQKAPRDEGEAKALAKEPPLQNFEQEFAGKVAAEQGKVTGPLAEKAGRPPSGGEVDKPPGEVPKAARPPAPKPVNPKLAAPKPKAWWEISLKRESDRLDDTMRQNRLSDPQLADSREPSFIETLKLKQEAQKKAAEAPDVYRKREAAILQTAQTRAGASLAAGLEGMGTIRSHAGSQVFGGQKKAETQTEKRQREIKGTIDGIYEDTVKAVKEILEGMATQVKDDFAKALKDKTDEFNREVRRRISDYYGDWRIDDDLFGPSDVVVLPDGKTRPMTLEEKFGAVKGAKTINPDVYRIFVQEKDKFVRAMDVALDAIAANVEAGLTAAHNRIRLGLGLVAIFKATLSGAELAYADGLEQEVKLKFENLEASVDDARQDLLETLADQYSENVQQLEKTFNEINDELKKGWLERAVEFIKTVGKTIFQLAELLFSILVRMAHLVWDIVRHPIRFFETLVAGLMQGIRAFIGNIGTYMQEAFWTWVTGTTSAKGIRLSSGSGVESLFGIVLQVLRLTPPDLRAIAEKVLGKEVMQIFDKGVQVVEKALEPIIILLTKGPGALWDYIKESLASIVRSSFDRIRESVFNTFIEKALKWVAGFFVPGGGFVKIVKAVFRAFQFVAENLERIRHFFDAVFDSMEAATQGKTEGVASRIIAGLKLGIVMALDFLAKQIGLSAIVDSVQRIIQSLRRPIVGAIEWLLNKLKPFALKLVAKGRELAAKALGGDAAAPPEQRLQKGVGEAQSAVNRLSGNVIGKALITPLLGAIRVRHALKRLDAEADNGRWVIVGEVNPTLRKPTAKLVDTSVTAGPARTYASHIRHGALRKITHGKASLSVGTRMTADPVGPDMMGRGTTVPEGPRADLRDLIDARQSRYRIGHLLNHHIGGSGTNWLNLTPFSPSGNALHFNRAEDHVRNIVEKGRGHKRWVYYDVVPRYNGHSSLPKGAHAAEASFATRLDIQWQPMEPDPKQPTRLVRVGTPKDVPIDLELPD